jgi:hypothetical protein
MTLAMHAPGQHIEHLVACRLERGDEQPTVAARAFHADDYPAGVVRDRDAGGSRREKRQSPIRASTAETVESGISSSGGDLGPCRAHAKQAAIMATRSSGVRRGTEPGAEGRSSSPAAPAAR